MGDNVHNMVPLEDKSKSKGKSKAKMSNSMSSTSSTPSTISDDSVANAGTSHLVTEMSIKLDKLKKMFAGLSQLGTSFKSVEQNIDNQQVLPYGEDNYFSDYELCESGDDYIEPSQVPHDSQGLCCNTGDIITDPCEKMCSFLQEASISHEDDEFSYVRQSLVLNEVYSEPFDPKLADIKTLLI